MLVYYRRDRHLYRFIIEFKLEFFKQFNAFTCLKFMHFLRDNLYENESLLSSVPQLLKVYSMEVKELSIRGLLWDCRKLEQELFNSEKSFSNAPEKR